MTKVVVALGGNALGNSSVEQLRRVSSTANSLVGLIAAGNQVVISHGNGPQIGAVNRGLSYAAENGKVASFPFPECGAMTQGYIGYHLQQSLSNELQQHGINQHVVTVITQVVVDPHDSAFDNPTKPIGDFYSAEQANMIAQQTGDSFKADAGRGYRRVVPSPLPQKIVELESIKDLIATNNLVIAAGGGGIPVVKTTTGFKGVPAVIDKDRTSALLADALAVDELIILTTVDHVFINYGQENQQAVSHLSSAMAQKYIKEEQFAAGSMLPKIEACLSFVKGHPHRKALITALGSLDAALAGKTGTIISE